MDQRNDGGENGPASFIVTLATFFILKGFKLGFSKLIIDNLTVGRISDAKGRGYEFWEPIFATVWIRNEHVFNSRDTIYTIGIIGGLALMAFAISELNFTRSATANASGLVISMVGIAGVVGGIAYMHNSDGVGANAAASVILAVSGLAAFVGYGLWRFERHAAGSVQLNADILKFLGPGTAAVIAGMIFAVAFEVESQESVLDLVSWLKWPLVVLAGAMLAWKAFDRAKNDSQTIGQRVTNVASIGFAAAFALYAFMFMTTEQGLRAILFGIAILGGFALLAIAASKAGRASPASRGVVLTIMAALLMAVAFFIRDQSESVKFRSELFSTLLVAALVLFVWAALSTLFAQRRFHDDAADTFGGTLAKVGGVAVAIGLITKLLFTTQTELDAEIPRAGFRISILWFFGFTLFATWLLGRTKFGSWIFAVGGNKQAARQVGVPAARTKTQLFMLVSVAAWLVGLLLAFRLDTVQSVAGNGLEFEYIIAAVVGGTLLTGGYGSAFGAAIGAVIVAMAKQGIPSARWNSDWRFAFLGLILLTAVIANNFIKTKAEESR